MRLALILLCLPVWGEVRILATPEPMAVLESLGLRTLGLWSITVCSEAAVPVTLPRERLVLALPAVRIVSNERARAVLAHAQGRAWQARVAGVIRYALLGSTAGTATARTQGNVVAGLALGVVLADQIARRLESEMPALAPWLAGLEESPMILPPGACGIRTVFAALQHGAKPVEAVIR